jgi:hypothetical protein
MGNNRKQQVNIKCFVLRRQRPCVRIAPGAPAFSIPLAILKNAIMLFVGRKWGAIIICFLFLSAFKVHDGDTITRISYRLAYIDAPELKQTCTANGKVIRIGRESQLLLKRLGRKSIEQCRITAFDRYNRAIVDCGYNLDMVRHGMASSTVI